MKRYNMLSRALALFLIIVFMLTTLCSCDSIHTKTIMDNQVLLSTFDLTEKNKEAFAQANYDIKIIMNETCTTIDGLPAVHEYMYNFTIEIYEKNEPYNMLADYEIKIDEIAIPLYEKNPYNVLASDPVTKDFPLKIYEILETWARFTTLSYIRADGFDIIIEKNNRLANDVRLHSTKTVMEIAKEYGESLKPELKDVVLEAAMVFEVFMIEEGLEGWLKEAIKGYGDIPDYMDKDQVTRIAEKMGEFMGKDSFDIITSPLNNSMALISDRELTLCQTNIATCIDEISETIIEANEQTQ